MYNFFILDDIDPGVKLNQWVLPSYIWVFLGWSSLRLHY